jgi:long-subunit fatty acid transport protein
MIRTVAMLLLALGAVLPRLAQAIDAAELISPSTKAQARGGADVAVGDSALSQIDNPATLTLSPRDRYELDIATQMVIAVASFQGPLDSADSDRKFIPIADMAFTAPVDDRLTLGSALHSGTGLASLFNFRHLFIPNMQRRVGSDMKCLNLELNAGYKLTDRLSVGIGGRFDMVTAEFSTVLGPADVEFGRGYAYGGGYQLGLHYRLRDDLAFGLAYRSPSWLSDLSGGHGRASLLGLLPVPLGAVSIEPSELPQRISAGLAWDATDWLKLVGEVRWLNWSNSVLHRLAIDADGLIDLRYPMPLGYRDQWVFIAGAEFKLSKCWRLGVGYHYATQAVPGENMLPEGSAIAHQHLTAGLRYERDQWWVGVGYLLAFPETLRGTGWSNIPLGLEYGFSEITQAQHILCTGFGFRW